MRQFDTALLNILIGCFLLTSNPSFAQSSKTLPTKVVGFNLPDDQTTGLVYCGFEITPELSLSRGNEYSSLHFRIKWQPSTAQSPKGGFQYRYRYNGKEYTDKMIGAQAFNTVRANSVSFEVVVSGESQMITTQISDIGGVLRDSNGQIIQFSKEASIEGFNIQVIGLKRVRFTGTQEIMDKVREYNVAEQTKAREASKASDSTNSSTNVVTNSNGNSTSNNSYSSSSNQNALNQNDKALSDFSREQQQKTDKFFQEKEDFNRSLASQNHLYSQSFYASQMANQAKDNLGQLTGFQGSYNSAEELEADFNAKFYAISREVENLNYARNEALNANVAIAFHGSDASGQAVGELIHSIGSLVNQNKAEKERKQAIEALRREREKILAEIAEKKKSLTREMRKGIIDRFTEGGLPTSSHHVGASVYFFAYFFDESTLGHDFPTISITNVFEIHRYSDGSWPLKSSILSQLKKLNSAKVTLVGYYSSAAAAEEMRTTLMNIAKKGDMKTGSLDVKAIGNPTTMGFSEDQKSADFSVDETKMVSKTNLVKANANIPNDEVVESELRKFALVEARSLNFLEKRQSELEAIIKDNKILIGGAARYNEIKAAWGDDDQLENLDVDDSERREFQRIQQVIATMYSDVKDYKLSMILDKDVLGADAYRNINNARKQNPKLEEKIKEMIIKFQTIDFSESN